MNITARLTGDAQVNTTSQDKQVVNFSVAINNSYKNKQGERIEQATFFDCSYWIGTAIAQYLTKGTLVELSGRVSARAWKGSDGEPRAGLNFHTSQIKLHGGGKRDNGQQPITAQIITTPKGTEDDLPF